MKPRFLQVSRASLPLATALAALVLSHSAQAQATRLWNNNGTTVIPWLTTTNWSPSGTFAGGAPLANPTGEGANNDIMGFVTANTGTTAGINMNTLSAAGDVGLILGGIDFNRTSASAFQIGNSSSTVNGILQLDGATINSVANTLIRVNSGNFTITNVSTGATNGGQTMGLRLGNTNGIFEVADTRTLNIVSAISEATANSGFTKTGAGTLVLTGVNTYTGTSQINAGILEIGSGGIITGPINVGNGSTFRMNRADTWSASNSPAIAISAGGSMINVSGNSNILNALTLNGGTLTSTGGPNSQFGSWALTGTVTVGGTVASTINESVSGSFKQINLGGDTGLATTSNTIFNVADATSSSAADLTISAALQNGRQLAFGSTLLTSSLTKSGAGTLVLSGANTYTGGTNLSAGTISFTGTGLGSTGNITFTGDSTLQWGASTTTDLSSRLVINNGITATLDTGSNNVALASAFGASGTGALAKTGAGTLTLSAQNTFTGGTLVSAGTLTLGHATNTLANSGAVNVDGGTLALGTNSDTVGAVTLTSGSITGSGTLTGSSYDVQSGNVSAILGGSGAITKSTSGTVTLSGSNTFSGGTLVSAGTLTLGHATDTLANAGAVNVDGGILALGTNSDTVGAVTLTSGSITGSGSGTLTGSSYGVQSGNVSAILAGSGVTLTKTTIGTVTLSANNTYTGTTTVSAGTMYVTGALASPVTVEANGTLGSNGAAGTLSAGLNINAGGNLDLTGATLGAGSTGILTLANVSSLTIGNLTFSDIVGWDWANAAEGTYELIKGATSINLGSTAYLSQETAFTFGTGTYGYFTATSGSLNAVIIPEPSVALLGAIGALALFRRRR